MTTFKTSDLAGNWDCSYWYPSNEHDGEDASEHRMAAELTGDQLTLQSLPGDSSYMFIRLHIEDIYAAGSWTESTRPDGDFHGEEYSGVLQLLISDDGRTMDGQWLGVGQNRQLDKPEVYHGRWQLRKI